MGSFFQRHHSIMAKKKRHGRAVHIMSRRETDTKKDRDRDKDKNREVVGFLLPLVL